MACHVVHERAAGPTLGSPPPSPSASRRARRPAERRQERRLRPPDRALRHGLELPGHDGRDHQGARAGRRRGLRRHRHARASTRSRARSARTSGSRARCWRTTAADLVVQVADARNLRRALMLTAQIARFGKPMILVAQHGGRGVGARHRRSTPRRCRPTWASPSSRWSPPRGAASRNCATRSDAPPFRASSAQDRRPSGPLWAHEMTERVRRVSALSLALRPGGARAGDAPAADRPADPRRSCSTRCTCSSASSARRRSSTSSRTSSSAAGINPAAIWLVDRFIPVPLVRDFLVGQYGLITMGVTYSIAIVLPVVATFFLMFGFLEDSGYIPRLAIFCDRIFRAMGLNGKAVLPMVLGLGCDTMATMTTRILGTPKERLIAILLLALGIPCSAQLATIMGILGGISFAALATLFGVVLGQMFLVGWLAARVLKGRALRVHHGAAADPLAASREPADQDAAAGLVVPRRSGAAVPRRHGAAVRPRPRGRARLDRGGRAADRDRAARAAGRDRADSPHGLPAARLRRGGAVPARAQRPADAACRRSSR